MLGVGSEVENHDEYMCNVRNNDNVALIDTYCTCEVLSGINIQINNIVTKCKDLFGYESIQVHVHVLLHLVHL